MDGAGRRAEHVFSHETEVTGWIRSSPCSCSAAHHHPHDVPHEPAGSYLFPVCLSADPTKT
jgi:hypothetical protein